MNENNITTKNCTFAVICSVPDGTVYQLLIPSKTISEYVSSLGEFKVLDEPLYGISIEHQNYD